MQLHPAWFDPRMPERECCVLPQLLERARKQCPSRVFARFADGSEWSFAQLEREARSAAAAFAALGVARGDRVLAWLPNGAEAIRCWFGLNLLGACFVPINPAYRGALLEHVIANTGARLMVAHGELLQYLEGLETALLDTLVVTSKTTDAPRLRLPLLGAEALRGDAAHLRVAQDLMPWDLQCILYTSGTTGPSKGVLSSYFHQYTIAGLIHGHMSADDRIFCNAPIFHAGGTGAVYAALIHFGSVAIVEGFRAADFWRLLRETGSTLTSGLLGSMAPYLAKAGGDEEARSNALRRTHFYPVSPTTIALARDYGFEYFSGYGTTEYPFVLMTGLDPLVEGSCGRPRSGIQARLVNSDDMEVARGEIGELLLRTEHTWSFMSGYHAMPQATLEAMRNGWYHTGDLFRQDEQGNYFFVDRAKDAIRRRGENISSQEVESAVYGFAGVADAAALGVPGEHGEDEVLVVVAPRAEQDIDPALLFDYLRPRLAHFMLPRYIRVLPALPRTPTDKVRKHLLREQGVTADTWDRERAGIVIRRERLE